MQVTQYYRGTYSYLLACKTAVLHGVSVTSSPLGLNLDFMQEVVPAAIVIPTN